jgi:hypothetical protein
MWSYIEDDMQGTKGRDGQLLDIRYLEGYVMLILGKDIDNCC